MKQALMSLLVPICSKRVRYSMIDFLLRTKEKTACASVFEWHVAPQGSPRPVLAALFPTHHIAAQTSTRKEAGRTVPLHWLKPFVSFPFSKDASEACGLGSGMICSCPLVPPPFPLTALPYSYLWFPFSSYNTQAHSVVWLQLLDLPRKSSPTASQG